MFAQVGEGNAVFAADALIEPFAKASEFLEGRWGSAPNQRGAADKVSAVAKQVPKASEAAHALHRDEIDEFRLKDFVWRMFAVHHAPFQVVPHDGSAAQTLE